MAKVRIIILFLIESHILPFKHVINDHRKKFESLHFELSRLQYWDWKGEPRARLVTARFSNNLIHTLDLEITTGGIFPNSVSVLQVALMIKTSVFLAENLVMDGIHVLIFRAMYEVDDNVASNDELRWYGFRTPVIWGNK